jgi:hypothetical protein
MFRRLMSRLVAAVALTAAVILAQTGCGGSKAPSEKAGDKKGSDDSISRSGSTGVPDQPPRKVDPSTGVGKEAFEFLKGLGAGTARADQLSAGFLKMVGVPAELPSDKGRGYSTIAAETWLKRVGTGATFGLAAGLAGTDVAILWGGFQGPGRKGDYYLRMVSEAGAWKTDFLALTSAANTRSGPPAPGTDADYQHFAARAVGGLLCDRDGMAKDMRAPALAAGMTPTLRAKLAEPFGSDKDTGFDYNRGKLILEAEKLGGGAESYSAIPQASPNEFRIEVMKTGGTKAAYLLRFVKGSSPGQWLVESIAPQ